MHIAEATTQTEIERCFPAIQTLRTHFTEIESFVDRVKAQQQAGYHLVYLEDNGQVQAIAGYRIREHLETSEPRYMYVADLVALPSERGKGYGKALFEWLEDTAKSAGAARLLLESGVQRHRAHKFYFNCGLRISCYRFEKDLY